MESVANAHTAADLHVRPVPLTALVSGAAGVANISRDTSWSAYRNGNDSGGLLAKTTSRLQNQVADYARSAKVLNLCTDSNSLVAVGFLVVAQNKFINRLRSIKTERNFRTGARRYADK
jgi:hypothetical protein